jgi:hypothetical protein
MEGLVGEDATPGERNRAPVGRGQRTPARPRWVKVFLLTIGVAVALFLLLHLLGLTPQHGVGQHMLGQAPTRGAVRT